MSRSPERVSELCPKAARLVDRAVVRAGARVTIEAGHEQVWTLLSEPNDWSDWYGGVKESKGTVPLKVGSKISFSAGPMSFSARVDELEKRRTLRFSGTSPGSSATYFFRIEPQDEGTEVLAAIKMGGLATMATRPIMQGVAEKAVLRWLDALAAAVEVASGDELT